MPCHYKVNHIALIITLFSGIVLASVKFTESLLFGISIIKVKTINECTLLYSYNTFAYINISFQRCNSNMTIYEIYKL